MDVRQTLQEVASRYGDKAAVVFDAETLSFAQLHHQVLGLAQALQAQGVQKGDKVGIYLPNSPAYVLSYLACFSLGVVSVPLDFMLKSDELTSCLDHAEVKVLIVQDKPEVDLASINTAVSSLSTLILTNNIVPEYLSEAVLFNDLLSRADADALQSVLIQETDPALIMYTSGTTGRPKGIVLNYKHLDGSPQAMHHFVDLTDKDIKLVAIPLSHIAGLIYIQNCITFGITLILMARFNPYGFLGNIAKYRVTCFHIVPAMYTAMLSVKKIDNYDLSSLRWVVVFGAPSSPEILERFHQYCPNAKLLNGWGMTETCPPNVVTPMDSLNIASVGKPAPHCEVQIFDEQDQAVPVGTIGEIVIRGWIIMDEYYKDPETTGQCKRNGWLYTGDLGRFDDEGFLYIVGRKKEMIKVGGQIVFAPEIETSLCRHEAILEAAVIGVPDDLRGEVVHAFVSLKEGQVATSEDLRHYAREHLANFKVPQRIDILSDLPKNRIGKIDKKVLQERLQISVTTSKIK